MANNTAEERIITVTLESGGQITPGSYGAPNSGYGQPQGAYPPPQGNFGPPPQGSYGAPLGNFGASPMGPVVTPPQGTHGGPPGNFGPSPMGPVVTPPQGTHGAPPGNFGPSPMGPIVTPPHGGFGTHNPQPTGFGINNQPQGGYGAPQSHPSFPPPPIPGAPQNANWMARPQNIPNCPPGLEYLTTIDTLIVNQLFNIAEVLTDHEPENQFLVTNSIGQNVYFAREESDDCSRKFCGSKRAFRMKVFDNFGNQIIQISRPVACQACCFPCCLQKMEVTAPPGTVVGAIEQEWSILYPTFSIKTPTGETILSIKGPWCTMNCYADVEFKVLTADGTNEVGKISKKWSGYASENSAKMDVFGISFPMDLDVKMKAVMLGACFLIDMMYFEQSVSHPNKANSHVEGPSQSSAPRHQELKPI